MKHYAILLLQEQYWSVYTKSSPIHHSWTLFEPTTINNEHPRTAIYINNNLLIAAQVTPIKLPFSDVTAIQLNTTGEKPMLIINVYNPSDKNIIPELHRHLHRLDMRNYETIIVTGDFNSHHPLWNPMGYTRHDEEADTLVEMMADLELNPLLPPGTITYPHAGTAIDLVWGNEEAMNRIIKCQIGEEHDHGSDHLPIETIIAIQIETPQKLPSYNYVKTDWGELIAKLERCLPSITLIKRKAVKCTDIDNFAEQLVQAISKAVEETTPRKNPTPHSKR